MITSPAQRKATRQQLVEAAPVEAVPVVAPIHRGDGYKRAFDLAVLIAAHAALFPIFLTLWTLVPLAIWLEDRGPIFYTQRRVGKGGRVFRLFKFRSMVVDAESASGPVWASDRDPRITRVGRFIRARALDELPQIINVWKGDLSLVGPRPERPELMDEFAQDLPKFLLRLQVRPGLTGLAQVFGRYATRPRDKLRYDILYIRNMSPWLDIRLLFLSSYVTLRGRWQSPDKKLRGSPKQPSESPQDSPYSTARSR